MKELIAKYSVPEPNSGCWLWTRAVSDAGYGKLWVDGRCRMATHISLEAVGRPVPKGMEACHHCDVPACVNPDHLFIGTQRDNIHDCMAKGRFVPPPRQKKGTRTNALFCRNGHPRTPGQGLCRICRRANELRKWASQKEQRAADRAIRSPPIYPCGPRAAPYLETNTKVCCQTCNSEKAAMSPELWARTLRYYADWERHQLTRTPPAVQLLLELTM